MRNVRTFVTINGEIHGSIWMPSAHCAKFVNTRVEIIHGADSLPREWKSYSIRAALNEVLNDGDFQSATFTPDTEIAIERERALPGGRIATYDAKLQSSVGMFNYRRRRVVDLSKDKDYVSECDGHDYGEDEE